MYNFHFISFLNKNQHTVEPGSISVSQINGRVNELLHKLKSLSRPFGLEPEPRQKKDGSSSESNCSG